MKVVPKHATSDTVKYLILLYLRKHSECLRVLHLFLYNKEVIATIAKLHTEEEFP